MRLITKSVITMAIAAVSVLAPSMASAQDATRVAIVDVAYIFKNHPGIKAQVTKVENDLKRYDGELKAKRDQLKVAAEKLKTFSPGSPDYSAQEEQVASMESKLRLDMARKRKELADAEAKIYFDNYQQITAGVKFLAEHNKINLVLRYNSEEMDQGKGDSVIRGVMKNIVFHDDALNMTPIVMQYLDRALKVASSPAATQR